MSRQPVSRGRRRSEPETLPDGPDPNEASDVDPEWEEPAFVADASDALPPVLRDGLRDALSDTSGDATRDDDATNEIDETRFVDPVTGPQRALMELFAARQELRFPGVDAKVLEAHATAVRALAAEVERARALLARAEAELSQGRQELGGLVERAHEYARIFARTDPALGDALDAIALVPEPAPKRKRRDSTPETPKRRGRPPKSDAVELPFAAS